MRRAEQQCRERRAKRDHDEHGRMQGAEREGRPDERNDERSDPQLFSGSRRDARSAS
jgi:hypothetical protein